MPKNRKTLIDSVLDRAGEVGRGSLDITRRMLTGRKKKKKKSSTRKLAESNTRAIKALALQVEQCSGRDREK